MWNTCALQSRGLGPRDSFVAATLFLLAVASLPSVSVCADEQAVPSNPPQRQKTKLVVKQEDVERWVTDLKHDDYEVRERAQRRLKKVGRLAIRPLIDGVQSADPEVSWRCGEILQYLSLHGDDATIATLSEVASKAATVSQHSGLLSFVNDMTYRRQERRHQVIKIRLQELGAYVNDALSFGGESAEGFLPDGFPAPFMPEAVEEEALEEEVLVETPLDAADDLEATPAAPADAIPADADPFGEEPPKVEGGEEVVDEPAELPAMDEPRAEPELATPADADPDDADPDNEEIEIEGKAESDELDFRGVLKDFREFREEGLDAKTEKEVPLAEGALILRGFMGGLAAPGVVDLDGGGAGRLIVDASFRGRDDDLKDVKDLLGVASVTLASPKLTDETLAYVAQMPGLAQLDVSLGAYTSAGMRAFRKARPDAVFFARGSAVLGIKGNTSGGPCRIDTVTIPSGAADAGLQQGDEIIELEGQAIETFADLTVEVYPRKPDEKIKVVYLRDGKRNETTILLRARQPGQ